MKTGMKERDGSRRGGAAGYVVVFVAAAVATVGVLALLGNINTRKNEARETVFRVVDITERTVDPAEWGQNFPRQYDSYKRTVDVEHTKHGGSEAISKLETHPAWKSLWDGYAFAIDFREERGHAYMLDDQRETKRVTERPQPGACLHCHASVTDAYRSKGIEAGAAGTADEPLLSANGREQLMKGFEVVCKMTYADATALVDHPVSCGDCHDPESMQLRITRPGFMEGIANLARSDDPVPHLPSVERWRNGPRAKDYDANDEASRQELRSMVCGQCHVEYYFKGDAKRLTYPWHKGLKMEQAEAYYDEVGWKDWSHKTSGSPLLKAQHPEFEMWSQGIHARSGVSCADCHMPYERQGAIKVSSHHVRSPLLNIAKSCQTCHNYPEEELRGRVERIQDRTKALLSRGEEAALGCLNAIVKARESGAGDDALKAARDLHRKAQWRLDYVYAENSMGFHAPQESARILGEAIDYARQGELAAMKAGLTK